jgi:hypothetical protein
MSDIAETYKELHGGKEIPPDLEKRLLVIAAALHIKPEDSFWLIILGLDYYQKLFEQMPASMRAESEVITRQVKEASAQVIRAATAEIEKNQAAARLEIEKTTAAQKAELVKTLGTVLPLKLGEALSSLESKIDKGSGRMKVAIITLAIALGLTVSGGLALFFLGENVGQQTVQQQRGQ